MWQKNISKYFSLFAKIFLGSFFMVILFTACSREKPCSAWDQTLNEPSCKKLKLQGSRSFTGNGAICGGANSRKMIVSCAPSSGTFNQCTSISNGLPVFSLLVANNQSGNFLDSSGILYSNCSSLLNAYNLGTLISVAAVYSSNISNPSDVVTCTSAGCTFTSPSCYSGWDTVALAPSGTANLPAASQYLSCTYIDTSSLLGINSIAVNSWIGSLYPVTISGNLNFNTGWVDAF